MYHRHLVRAALRFLPLPALLVAAHAPAQTAAPLPAASPNDPVERLSRYLRVLSASPNNVDALKGAGRAALDVGDPSAAVGFFARAQEAAPRDGRVKAGLGAALVQLEQPRDALKLFAEAETLDVPVAEFAADRGLAYDLRGDGRRAQADYRLALAARPGDDETVRRLALSQAMSGDRQGALATLDPLLRRQDRAAWRASTFVLAMTGDKAAADARVGQLMVPAQAQAMRPFLDRLTALKPAEQAAAVHFGHFPQGAVPRNMTRTAAVTPVAPPPTRVAMAAPVPTPAATAPQTRYAARTAAPDRALVPAGVALGTAVPSTPVRPAPAATYAAASTPQPLTRPTVVATPTAAPARYTPAPAVTSPYAAPVQTTAVPAGTTDAAVVTPSPAPRPVPQAAPPVLMQPAEVAGGPDTRGFIQMKRSEWATPDLPAPAASPIRSAAPAARAATTRPAATHAAPTTAPSARIAAGRGPARAATARAAEDDAAAAVLPGRGTLSRLKLADAGDDADAVAAALPGRGTLSRLKLASADEGDDVAASLPGRGTLSRLKLADASDARSGATKPARDDAGTPTPRTRKGRAASDDAADDRKRGSRAGRTAAETKPVKGQAERYWVQVAGGANKADLPKAWKQAQQRHPELAGRTPHTTPLRATNRLLVGPFKSEEEAQAFVNRTSKTGFTTFTFTSAPGQKVEAVAAK